MSNTTVQGKQQRVGFHQLPKTWTWSCLGELGIVRLGKTPRKADYRDHGDYKIVKFRDVDESGKIDWDNNEKGHVSASPEVLEELQKLKEGDVLVTASAHMSGHIGKKVGIAFSIPRKYKDVFVVGELLQIRTKDGIDPRWVFYFLGSAEGYKAIQRRVHGVHLIGSRAQHIEVPLAPFNEQQRIVAEIEKQFSRLDEAVTSLKRVKANLKRYKAAVLKAAVEGKLTEDWRKQHPNVEPASKILECIMTKRRSQWSGKGQYKEPSSPDTSDLPDLPDRWSWATMPQLGELNRGKSKHRPRNDPKLFGGPYPFIQTGDVKHSGGFIRSHSQAYNESGLAQSRLWPTGTLCITIAANIAETGILTYPVCFPDSIVGFVFDSAPVTIRFIDLFFRTEREEIARFAPATAQKNINLEILSEIAVPLPPLGEQKEIVDEVERRLSVIEELEAIVEANLTRADRLRQSILNTAFSGKLVR